MNTGEYQDGSHRVGTLSQAPTTKFIQICASQNDLFALDADGDIYQYNFNTKGWLKLVASRSCGDTPELSSARHRGAGGT
jgi:hypothetical protein